MTQSDLVNLIAQSAWFAGVPAEGCKVLAAASRTHSFDRGSYVYSAGELTTDVYCLLSGRLRLGMTSVLGQEFVVTDIEPGSWFGEQTLASDAPRVMDAAVVDKSSVLSISRHVVLEMGDKYPVFFRNLFQIQTDNNRQILELLGGMLFYPLRARLAGRLLQLVEQHGEKADGGVYVRIKLSQNDFARLSLGSRQRINKIFREWYEQDIIVMQGEFYFIKNLPALQKEIDLTDL